MSGATNACGSALGGHSLAWDANREEWVCGCGHSAGRAVKVGPIVTQECGSAGPHEGPAARSRPSREAAPQSHSRGAGPERGLRTLPIPVKRAQRWNARVHRRLKRVQGGMWAVVVLRGDTFVGTAIVGRPNARELDANGDEAPQPALQVLRVACEPDVGASGHKGACSMLYGAVARAARAMGCVDLWTYIHDDESGVSLRAAGWVRDDEHESKGGSYDRPSRSRRAPVEAGPKVRWWAPWSRSAPARNARATRK